MLRRSCWAWLAAGLLAMPGLSAEPLSDAVLAEGRALRSRALADDTAYGLVRSLTTEVGPRLAGSAGDARAVQWAVDTLRRQGFANVRHWPVLCFTQAIP